MPKCHILTNVEILDPDDLPFDRRARLTQMKRLVTQLGYEPVCYGLEICDYTRAFNLETQMSNLNGLHVDYADHILSKLVCGKKGDIILATEGWHRICFRGLLAAQHGFFEGMPVIEMWIDYHDPFAVFKVFSSNFAAACYAGKMANMKWNPYHIVCKPTFRAKLHSAAFFKETYVDDDPMSMKHMFNLSLGVPTVAPNYGVWAETIVNGLTGYLVNHKDEIKDALARARALPSQRIIDHVGMVFSSDQAEATMKPYIERVLHAREDIDKEYAVAW